MHIKIFLSRGLIYMHLLLKNTCVGTGVDGVTALGPDKRN